MNGNTNNNRLICFLSFRLVVYYIIMYVQYIRYENTYRTCSELVENYVLI